LKYLFFGSWREWHAFVTPGNTDTSRLDEITSGVKISKTINLSVSSEARLGMFHVSVGLSGVVVLNDLVKQLLVSG
jgi:hypothetical protein